ncbi:Ral guanine nucleotide dissociation stimulator [Tupaia chinensis]|uniref:Ral guanine nucleotide dissociation stimulator n=1 Tax=Tupaia chinensis TaxID=246437 RepID=L9KNP3_TUPCH|nr:Ral guanine nucleotide dissociation stimulator [Tupaia chinensis]
MKATLHGGDGLRGPENDCTQALREGLRQEGEAMPLTLLSAPNCSDRYSILETWVDCFSEDFQQAPDFLCLKQLLAYMTLNMPCSDLEHGVHHLLTHLESSAILDADPEG